MAELIQLYRHGNQLRYRLLVTVSSAAILACIVLAQKAKATEADGDHPTVWIEVGGAFDQMSAGETEWLPPNLTPPISNPKPLPFGKLPSIGLDIDLKVSFMPDNSDWVYSASIRYGRAQFGPKHSHDQTYKVRGYYTYFDHLPKTFLTNYDFANAAQQSRSTHTIIDFMAGKDVGLGILGGGKSVISVGIRIAKLNESAEGQLTAFTNAQARYSTGEVGHKAELLAARNFTGMGPSVSWDASAPLAGSLSNGLSIDWGVNVALLFGRQKANVSLRTRDTQYYPDHNYTPGHQNVLSQSTQTPPHAREVVVPNLGGFAGFSWCLPNFKVSLGYRADFFFGAIDGGLLTVQKETRGFYGPFTSVSVGLGG